MAEVIVVGGGLVGAAAALGLRRQGYGVTLLEPSEPNIIRGRLGVDIRNVALNPQSQSLLSDIDVWQQSPVVPYNAMQVWEESGTGKLSFHAADVGRQELGWLLEMTPLASALYQTCQDKLTVVQGEFADLTMDATGVTVTTAEGRRIEADFMVAADGVQSSVRQALQIPVQAFPVGQHALATVVETERHHAGVAYQRFLRNGPLALLPSEAADAGQKTNLVSVVWSQPADQAAAHQTLPEEEFCAVLTRRSEGVLGQISAVDQRFCFPLHQQVARNFVKGRVVLVGDAARVVHPLAGLGVNLGFEDVIALLSVTAAGNGLLSSRALAAFNRQRRTRSLHMVRLLGLLQATYGEQNPWLLWARNKATHQLNGMSLVKQQIMREAMGLGPIAAAS